MPESHKQRTLRGINWNFLRVFGQTALGLVVGVVLARLLPPANFGLLAIALVFIGFAELVSDLGMKSAIIRLKVIEDSDIRIATTLSLLMGSLLVVLVWAIAQAVADFFNSLRWRIFCASCPSACGSWRFPPSAVACSCAGSISSICTGWTRPPTCWVQA